MARIQSVVSELERKHIISTLEKDGVRLDGRKPMEIRPIRLVVDFGEKAEGSATLSLGKTKIAVGIKTSAGNPFPDTPEDGVLITNLELPPLASPLYETGPPRAQAIELSRVVDRGIRESNAVALDKLLIAPGHVWILFVDGYVMDDYGNVIDAMSMASMAALASTKIPKAIFDDVEETLIVQDEKDELALNTMIATFTFAKIGGFIVVDPDINEERAMIARFTVSVTDNGLICALQKGEAGTFTQEEVSMMLHKARELAPERIKMIRDFVSNPQEEGLTAVFESNT